MGRALSAVLGAALLAAAALGPTPIAQATPTPGPDDDPVRLTRVDFGWNNVMPQDSWAPVIVWLAGGDAPSSGTIELEYRQDATQHARVILPYATTPGVAVPFETEACISESMRFGSTSGEPMATITIRDDSGWQHRYPVVTVPNKPDEVAGPQTGRTALVVVGDCGASTAYVTSPDGVPVVEPSPDDPQPPPGTPRTDKWNAQVTRVPAKSLPLGWLAYEGVGALAARADDLAAADPRAREALMDWVRAGGRLILEVDGAGGVWTQFVPDPDALVLIDAAAPLRPEPTIGDVAPSGRSVRITGTPVPGRLIRLTPDGLRHGWRVGWPAQGEPDSRAGLIASGPVGMGEVTLLGLDPARLPTVVTSNNTRYLWRQVITGSAYGEPVPTVPSGREINIYPNAMFNQGSGGTPSEAAAILASLDRIAQVPPLNDSVFFLIALSVLALAMLVGPFDRVMLRRRSLERFSWLTALAWITLASLAAYLSPSLVRSSRTSLASARMTDVLQGPRGPRSEWTASLGAVFAGRSLAVGFEPTPGAWWRGVSSVESYRGNGRAFSPFTTLVSTAQPRAIVPGPARQGQWTFRSFMAQEPERAPTPGGPEARVTREADSAGNDTWHVTVTGLPPGMHATRTKLLLRTGDVDLTFVTGAPEGKLELTSEGRSVVPPSKPEAGGVPDLFNPRPPDIELPLTQIPGASVRTRAIQRRVATGSWACVYVEMEGAVDRSGLRASVKTDPFSVGAWRLLVPLAQGDWLTQDPAPPTPPTPAGEQP